MSLLNFHGNTRERLHPWRNLPESDVRLWEQKAPARGEAGDGHGRGSAELLACLRYCFLQEEKQTKKKPKPPQIGDLKAAFATKKGVCKA